MLVSLCLFFFFFFFFSSRRRHTRYIGDWSSDVCSSDLRGSERPFDPILDTRYPRLSAGKRRALRERPDLVCQRPSWAILIRRASAAAESLWLAPAVSPKEQRDAHRSAADPAAHPPHSRELHAGK